MVPTFEGYLTSMLNTSLGLEFEALPLAFGEEADQARSATVDYVFTNAGAFGCLMAEFQVSSVASLVNYRKGHALDRFAGVIVSRADSNFSTVEDLRRARVAAAGISGLGAMQLQQAALLKLGINVMTDAEQIIFTGNQNKIVEEVQNGWADVGFVRTDMIDRVVARGDTRWEYFQVINEVEDAAFPFRRSTDLTPEWPFGALAHVPADTSKQVGLALMQLDRFSSDPLISEPAIAGSFVTFAPPKNYLDLLTTLESVGYYSRSENRCLQAADVLGFVQCPAGWVKQRPEVAFCPPEKCRSEYTCLCRPCVQLKDPELVLTVEVMPTNWNLNVNSTAVAAQTSLATSCSRMSRCASAALGQRISWRLLDQIGDTVRAEINQYRLHTVELLTELHGSWQPLTMEYVVIDGLQTQQYILNTTLHNIGETIVQLRINGEQAAISPVIIDVFEPILQPVFCPAGHRVEPDGSCSACPPGTKGSSVLDIETGINTPSCVPCEVGSFQELQGRSYCQRCTEGFVAARPGSASCTQCPPGSSTLGEEGASVCTPCLPGQREIVTPGGLKICQDCPTGRFAAAEGSTECLACTPGSYSPTSGGTRCLPCLPGSSTAQSGSEKCEPCPRGTYAEAGSNLTQCDFCGRGMTTQELGAHSASLCRCPVGSFLLPGSGCESCEGKKEWEGLECPGGNAPPLQVAGFWVQVLDASARRYSVYRCRSALECPGGTLGRCAAGRQGQACNDCKNGYASADMGECGKCQGSSMLPLLGGGLASLVALVCLVVVVDVDRNKRSLNQLTVLMAAGQLVMALQALTAVRQMPIVWSDPVKSSLNLMSIFTFDMDLLKVSCVFQRDDPLVKFGMQLLAYPCFACMLMVVVACFRLLDRKVSFDSIFNLNGILLFMLFITITLTVLTPFQCAPNPNGTTYMSLNPGITCWTSQEHVALVVLALLGTLVYPVSILSWTVWTTLQYPRRVHTGEGLRLIHRHRFLFERFNIQCYYYGVLLMLRNAAVALVPVLFVAVPVAQLVSMAFVFLLGQSLQNRLWPWRTEMANRADLGTAVCLILVLIACAPLLSVESDVNRLLLTGCLCVTVLGAVLSALGAIGFGLYRRLVPAHAYQVYLCHHKASAGSFCRYLKLMLVKFADDRVFLDSDGPQEDLDSLFEIVRCNCRCLVLVMTPEVLKSVECAGEIVTAHRNHVHIVPLRCEGLALHPSPGQVSRGWTVEQKHMLASFGIIEEHVIAAYRHVRELPYLDFHRWAAPSEQEEAIFELIDKCKLARRPFLGATSHSGHPRIVILGAVSDMEAMATCQIVEFFIRSKLLVETMTLRNAEEAEVAMGCFTHVVVVLTRGLLSDPIFFEILGKLGLVPWRRGSQARARTPLSQPELVIVNADASFEFPDCEYYDNLDGGPTQSWKLGDQGPVYAEALRNIFSVQPCPLTPHGCEGLLGQQMDEVCYRIEDGPVDPNTSATPRTPATPPTPTKLASPIKLPVMDTV